MAHSAAVDLTPLSEEDVMDLELEHAPENETARVGQGSSAIKLKKPKPRKLGHRVSDRVGPPGPALLVSWVWRPSPEAKEAPVFPPQHQGARERHRKPAGAAAHRITGAASYLCDLY